MRAGLGRVQNSTPEDLPQTQLLSPIVVTETRALQQNVQGSLKTKTGWLTGRGSSSHTSSPDREASVKHQLASGDDSQRRLTVSLGTTENLPMEARSGCLESTSESRDPAEERLLFEHRAANVNPIPFPDFEAFSSSTPTDEHNHKAKVTLCFVEARDLQSNTGFSLGRGN